MVRVCEYSCRAQYEVRQCGACVREAIYAVHTLASRGLNDDGDSAEQYLLISQGIWASRSGALQVLVPTYISFFFCMLYRQSTGTDLVE